MGLQHPGGDRIGRNSEGTRRDRLDRSTPLSVIARMLAQRSLFCVQDVQPTRQPARLSPSVLHLKNIILNIIIKYTVERMA